MAAPAGEKQRAGAALPPERRARWAARMRSSPAGRAARRGGCRCACAQAPVGWRQGAERGEGPGVKALLRLEGKMSCSCQKADQVLQREGRRKASRPAAHAPVMRRRGAASLTPRAPSSSQPVPCPHTGRLGPPGPLRSLICRNPSSDISALSRS